RGPRSRLFDRWASAIGPPVVGPRRSRVALADGGEPGIAGPGRTRRLAGRLRPEAMAIGGPGVTQPSTGLGATVPRAGLGWADRGRDAVRSASLRRRPIRTLRQESDRRVCRRDGRRPGLGYRPRPRPDRPCLAPSRARINQAVAEGTGLERALS